MKFKFGLNLPWGIYVSIVFLLIIATVIWDRAPSIADKTLINYLCLIFSCSTIQAALLIRMGKFETYKNILNAIWNIETAVVFLYGIYSVIELSHSPSDIQPSFTNWAFKNLESFTLIVIFFGVICVARAGYSVAEVFKNPILKSITTGTVSIDGKKSHISPKKIKHTKKTKQKKY